MKGLEDISLEPPTNMTCMKRAMKESDERGYMCSRMPMASNREREIILR